VELLRDANPEQGKLLEQGSEVKFPSITCTPLSAILPAESVASTTFPVMVEQLLILSASSWDVMVVVEHAGDVAATLSSDVVS
jgi:hypothetical protein